MQHEPHALGFYTSPKSLVISGGYYKYLQRRSQKVAMNIEASYHFETPVDIKLKH